MDRLENLSPEEFRILEDKVKKGYKQKKQQSNSPENKLLNIPGTHRRTKEEIEAHLRNIFTPEQLIEIAQTDISNIVLPPGAKTTAEILEEDREDRF